MFTISAISNARDYQLSTVSTVFLSRKGLVFGFPNSFRKTVPGSWISNLKGPIGHFSLGSCHETSDDCDDRSRDLLQSVDSGLILSTEIRWCTVCYSGICAPGWK